MPMPETVSLWIAELEAEIPELLHREDIPGMAIAIVSDGAVLGAAGFGVTERRRVRVAQVK